MSGIRFQNFAPKDDDLMSLYQPGVSVAEIAKSLETELNRLITDAKSVQVSKTPIRPNWDLKRDFAARNKRLDVATLRAIAVLNGRGGDEVMGADDESPRHSVTSPRSRKLSFAVDELSEDEDVGFNEAKRMMGGLSKEDANRRDESD